MEDNMIKTQFCINKEAKDLAIYKEWNELMKQPGAMVGAVNQHLCRKYGVYATSTIWSIRKRVEKRLKKQEN